jgi:DNA-binding transcriptional MerR regulator
VSGLIGAEHGERRPDDRMTHRNGYRAREWQTEGCDPAGLCLWCLDAARREPRPAGQQEFAPKLCKNASTRARAVYSIPSRDEGAGTMKTLRTGEAAALLNVSPSTLRSWERRFGYPKSLRSPGHHRLYAHGEIIRLRDALQEGLSISSAVSAAREAVGADAGAILKALDAFNGDEADTAMERSLALRTIERSVEEMLLPSLDAIRRRKGAQSAHWAFALGWSAEWLMRARRLATISDRRGAVLLGDASSPVLDPARPSILALELWCVRSGFDVMSLPVQADDRLAEVIEVIVPDAIVIAGSHATDQEVARWAYRVKCFAGRSPFVLYLRGLDTGVTTPRARLLPISPLAAYAELITLLKARPPIRTSKGSRRSLNAT